ncbi:MAG: FAD-dependent oxidoreductase, partial [Oscillospiraceae bacterium]|nr:FAD-dependent oxidoreductase [Oscillospiraceae bacterium]
MPDYDIIIVGGGPAGLTAAIYGRRAGLSVCIFEAMSCGGQIINSQEVDNYPARPHVSGFELMADWQKQAQDFGAEIRYGAVTGAEERDGVKVVRTAKGEFTCRALIIAGGAEHRKLDCPGTERLYGRGISTCATCDGAFFRGKETAVVGGGNTAFEDAIYLSGLCSKVYLINRRPQFRAEPKLVEALRSKENVEILTPYVPQEVLGDKRVSGFVVRNTQTGESLTLPVSGIFTAIGMIPKNAPFASLCDLDEGGYIITDEECRTRTPGVFAAGDTRRKTLR